MGGGIQPVTRILVTGSSGWLGQTLVPLLAAAGHEVVGLDPVPAATTRVVGSIVDRDLVRATIRDFGIGAVIHAGALHKPNVATHERSAFVAVNVHGTLNLLEEAVAPGSPVDRFIMTSTTSLMISREIRAGRAGGARRAAWITEEMAPLLPRNIYGVTKLSAEQLCRLFHELFGLPVLVLRTARFFPEEDDMAHTIVQSEENTKANELLFRRATVADIAEAHRVALDKAPALGFDTFIICARTPFSPADCEALITDAPAVVRRYHPDYPEIYARLGWTMFDSIDRVYDSSRAARVLGFTCKTGFGERLRELAGRLGGRPPSRAAGERSV
jgi:UDP-glucose 4-epimerase